jgi:hypothetical protein
MACNLAKPTANLSAERNLRGLSSALQGDGNHFRPEAHDFDALTGI